MNLRRDLELSLLKIAQEAAEGRYMDCISALPAVRQRTPDQQREADMLLDALHKASREWRNARDRAFWESHEAGAEETRQMFPFLRAVK